MEHHKNIPSSLNKQSPPETAGNKFQDEFIIGCLHFGGRIDISESESIIASALASGFNQFETAPIYGNGNASKVLSDALRKRADAHAKVYVKYGLKVERARSSFSVNSFPITESIFNTLVAKDLEYFGNSLFSIQFHSPNRLHQIENVASAIKKIETQIEKQILIGMSNCSDKEFVEFKNRLARIGGFPEYSIQYQANVFEQRHLAKFSSLCADRNTIQIVNRALCRGLLASRTLHFGAPAPKSRGSESERISQYFTRYEKSLIELLKILHSIAKRHGCEVEHLAIKFLLEKLDNKKILIGVSSKQQFEQLLDPLKKLINVQIATEIESNLKSSKVGLPIMELPETYFER